MMFGLFLELLRQVALLACFVGAMASLAIVVCEVGVWFGWIEKEEEEK